MGPSSIPRRTGSPESLPISNGSPSPPIPKKKLSNLFPLFVTFVVMAQIALLGRLDVAKNIVMVDSWTELLYKSKALALGTVSEDLESVLPETDRAPPSAAEGCEEWLEREDAVTDSRDFDKDPVFVYGSAKGFRHCSVGCEFDSFPLGKEPDAGFGTPQNDGTASVLRSMESSHYYRENDTAIARRRGYDIVMTTSLSSDVPVGYFSWAEYDIMAPVQPKTEKSLAAAFITNCAAHNFRMKALIALGNANVTIDSYGACYRTHDGRKVDKVTTLKRYKFSLAFENSNEEDYVTEKFFQSLVAGSIPVVVGAPNIQDFAPCPNSFLHIKNLSDVPSIAETMQRLGQDSGAYNQSLRWKYEGPSDSFKALFDMGSVHSSCRLCIHVATMIRDKEEKSLKDRPCKCTRGSQTTYHLYVRERGRFNMHSIFLRSGSITLEALESAVLAKFKSLNHVPIWKPDRPESIRGGDELKIHRIYPVGMTQRQALYTFRFRGNEGLEAHIERNLCSKFEVIFV